MWVGGEVRMYDPINLVPFEADAWSKGRRDSLMQMASNDSYKYLAVMNPTQQGRAAFWVVAAARGSCDNKTALSWVTVYPLFTHAGKCLTGRVFESAKELDAHRHRHTATAAADSVKDAVCAEWVKKMYLLISLLYECIYQPSTFFLISFYP